MITGFGLKTFESYGKHAIPEGTAHRFDVLRYVSGVHPTRLADIYTGRHALEADTEPVTYLDAFHGWVRDDYANGVVRERVLT